MRQIGFSAAVAAFCVFGVGLAHAQAPQPAVPSVTTGSEEQDSGVGAENPDAWVGKTVVTADDREVGRIASVRISSDTADNGVFLVEHEGRTIEVPATGSSVNGDRVIVSSTYERLTAN